MRHSRRWSWLAPVATAGRCFRGRDGRRAKTEQADIHESFSFIRHECYRLEQTAYFRSLTWYGLSRIIGLHVSAWLWLCIRCGRGPCVCFLLWSERFLCTASDGAGQKPAREAVSFDCNLTFSEPVGGMARLPEASLSDFSFVGLAVWQLRSGASPWMRCIVCSSLHHSITWCTPAALSHWQIGLS